jgi:hypothetical protein
MVPLIALAAVGLFAAGVTAGIVGVASVAIRREEKSHTLTSEATAPVTRAGRWVNGAYVRDPRRARTGRLDHRQRHHLDWPAPDVALALQAPSPSSSAHPAGHDPDAR